MNLADPELELIDPTPNVHSMFLHFDKIFFWTKLASRCVVRWSKRMYSCAGTCQYEVNSHFSVISLSEPLLKLRPRKDLVETLLHEMIHAFLFITNRDQDRDGHGPNFRAHMHRINKAAGLNISIYHDFHEEVELYQTHWWRCDGPCQTKRPHFGIVRRSCNRPPGPSDYWWKSHQRNCGGTFIKIKEPEKPQKAAKEPKGKKTKPNADITKYINNNNDKGTSNKNITSVNSKKDTSNKLNKTNADVPSKSNGGLVVNKKNVVFNPQVTKPKVLNGIEEANKGVNKRTSSGNVQETVRNVWSNKQIGINSNKIVPKNNISSVQTPSKHKAESHSDSPPAKMKKIDDYFKNTAYALLKDIYGPDFSVTQPKTKDKLNVDKIELDIKTTQSKHIEKPSVAVEEPKKRNLGLVSCPVCSREIESSEINGHLDECLNTSIIDELSQRSQTLEPEQKSVVNSKKNESNEKTKQNKVVTEIPPVPFVKEKCGDSISNGINVAEKEGFNKFRKLENLTEPTIEQNKNNTSGTKLEPGSSKNLSQTECLCCGDKLNTSVDEHLEECQSFLENNTSTREGPSTSFGNEVIVIDDDDDVLGESQTLNSTGTKLPCPCCFKMVEEIDMNNHLDKCLK